MPIYNYKLKNLDGQSISGQLAAATSFAAAAALRREGVFIIHLRLNILLSCRLAFLHAVQRPKTSQLAVFCQSLSAMLQAGLPLLNSLNLLAEQTSCRHFKQGIGILILRLQEGQQLSSAAAGQPRHFPPLLVSMLAAGEAAGMTDIVLNRLGEHFERQLHFQQKLQSALRYPLIVAVLALGIVIILLFTVLPAFQQMFQSLNQPAPPAFLHLLNISSWLCQYGSWLLTAAAVLGLFFALYRDRISFTPEWLFKLPYIAAWRQAAVTARFSRSLGMLLAAGLPITQALPLLSMDASPSLQLATMEIRRQLDGGSSLAAALAKQPKFFVPLAIQLTASGEESGTLPAMLEKTAILCEQKLAIKLNEISSTAEPLLILGMSAIIGLLVVSVLSALLSISTSNSFQ